MAMSPRLRFVLLLACGALVLAVGVFALSQSRAVRQRVLVWAEATVTEAVGREVRVEEVVLRPWLGSLDLSGIRVGRDRSLASGVLFAADRVRFRWSWIGLLRRELVLQRVTLVRPRLTLAAEAAPGLSVKDVLALLLQSRPAQIGGWVLRVRQATVQDGQAVWTEADGTRGTLEGLEGDLAWSGFPDGIAAASGTLRAVRLRTSWGGATRELDGIRLNLTGTHDAISVAAAEFQMAGASLTARGHIADPGRAPQLDLSLGIQAPLAAVLAVLGSDRHVEGMLQLDGRLDGPWQQARFRGEGSLVFGADRAKGDRLGFALRWEDGRVEAETLEGAREAKASLRAGLILEPATGLFRVRASLADADLTALAGLPAAVAAQAGVELPTDLRGRVTADVDLEGKGADLTTLRGRATLRAEDLRLSEETPAGHLEARLTATTSRLDVETFALRLPGGDIQGRGSLIFASGTLNFPIRAELREVAAFGRGFGIPLVGGVAAFQGRVLGTREAPTLQGRVTWRDARIAGRRLDLVEGEVEVARRVLKTPRLILRIGQTTATVRGSLAAAGAAPLRRLNPMRDVILDIQGRMDPGRTADLVQLLPENLQIQGGFRASGRLAGPLQAPDGEIELRFQGVRTWEESWQRGEALLRLRQGAMEISRISLRRGAEQLAGNVGVDEGGVLRGRLTSTPMDLAQVGSLSGTRLRGRASFRLDLEGTLDEARIAGQATAEGLVYRDIPMGAGTATFKVERKAVAVDLTVREGTYRVQVSLGPPPDRTFKGELTLSGGDLDVVVRAGGIEALRHWQARGSGRILIQGPAEDPTSGTGEMDLGSLRLQREAEAWENRGPVRITWNGPTYTVRQLRLRSGVGDLEIRGTAGNEATDVQVTGQLPLVALADYFPIVRPRNGLAIADVRLRGPRSALEVHGSLDIRQGNLALTGIPAEFREVRAMLNLQGNRTQVERWQAVLAEGSFRGAGEIQRNGDRWGLRLAFQEENGRAEQLLAGLYRGKGEVTGALSLGGVLTSEGEESADFWRNLTGDLKLSMRDGRIGQYTVMAKILALLNVAQLLELKGPELGAGSMPYHRLTADIKIGRGIARTENLVLDSPAMKVNAVGQVDLADETADLTVAVKPFQTVDRIVTKIPVAGWLLGGKEQSLLVAYFQVTGSLSDPKVTPIPLRSVGRNLFGIFRNLLEIPEALTGPYEDLPPQSLKPDGGKGR